MHWYMIQVSITFKGKTGAEESQVRQAYDIGEGNLTIQKGHVKGIEKPQMSQVDAGFIRTVFYLHTNVFQVNLKGPGSLNGQEGESLF